MDTVVVNLAEKQAAQCRTFGSARRLVILWVISKEELSVNEIAERVGSSLQNVSQHLTVLKKSGIVTTRRDGQKIFYQIVDNECLKNCPALLRAPGVLD